MERGDQSAGNDLLPLVYEELRRLAAQKLAREAPGQTLQPTALVHEAYLRLIGEPSGPGDDKPGPGRRWDGRGHFFAAAAEAMRRLLINRARDKGRIKRGGSKRRIRLDLASLAEEPQPDDLLDLHEALEKLSERDALSGRLVELRFFAGLSLDEAARILEIPRRTADRRWAFARAWLFREMQSGEEPEKATR